MSLGTFSFGGPAFAKRTKGIEQEVIMSVARLSNFNVLLQACHSISGGMDCRAYCKTCQEFIKLDFDQVTASKMDNEIWTKIGLFCEQHRHDGTQHEERTGRRLREEV
jgi:hypothetical protein